MASTTVIVIQFEPESIKFGIAGETAPRFEYSKHDFLTRHVSYHRKSFLMNSNIETRNFIIDKKLQYLDTLNIIFTEKLALKAKDCVKVVIIEDIFETKINRDILLTVLLKDMMVTEVTMQPDLFMPILATQNLSGIVLDIGYNESRAIAIFQGRPIMHTLQVLKIGLNDVLTQFSDSIDNTADTINDTTIQNHNDPNEKSHRRIITDNLFKKHAKYIPSSTLSTTHPVTVNQENEIHTTEVVTVPGTPEGRVHIPTSVLDAYQALIQNCLLLFIIGKKEGSEEGSEGSNRDRNLAEILLDCLQACNVDVRGSVVNHIVISGAGAAIPGIPEGICDAANEILSYDEGYAKVAATVHSKRNRSVTPPSPSPTPSPNHSTNNNSNSSNNSNSTINNNNNSNNNINDSSSNSTDDTVHMETESCDTVDHHATATATVTRKFIHALKPAWCAYASRAHWAWVGGSLFGAVKANHAKFVRAKDVSVYTVSDQLAAASWSSSDILSNIPADITADTHGDMTTANSTITTTTTTTPRITTTTTDRQPITSYEYELYDAPDWMAATGLHSHWTFFGNRS